MSETPTLVADAKGLDRVVASWRGERVLAFDTEAASFHRFQNRIYLIQVSTRETTAIIDPLAVEDLSPVGQVLADPAIEIVFHDADYDLRLLDHQYGFVVRNLFDTRTAAEFVGEPGLSLAALLEAHFGLKVDKRFQRADWSARPLSDDMLAYAAGDTARLIALRDILHQRLEEVGRLEWALEEFRVLEGARWQPQVDREPAFLRIKGARSLRPRQLAVLKEVHRWRVGLAAKKDRAEFRIMSNEALLALARTTPRNEAELERVKGVGKETARRRGRAILAAIRRGVETPDSALPKPRPPVKRVRQPEVEARLARLKTAREAVVKRIGLAPGVILPNSLLEAIAKNAPKDEAALGQVDGVRAWQAEAFGAELLSAIGSSEQS